MGILATIVSLLFGALLTYFIGWYRTNQRRKRADAEQMKKVAKVIDDHAFLLENFSDRMLSASNAIISVATACKNGTPAQAARAIEIMEASAMRFSMALTNRMTKKAETIPDAEPGEA